MVLRLAGAARQAEDWVRVPGVFVRGWLSSSACKNPLHVVVYLFAMGCENGMFSVAEAAESLEISKHNVLAALEHWQENGLLEYGYANGIVTIKGQHPKPQSAPEIEYEDAKEPPEAPRIQAPTAPVQAPAGEDTADHGPPEETDTPHPAVLLRPDYTPQELEIYRDSTEVVRALFDTAQTHLGRLLNYSDMNSIFSFYDWLRLPPNTIEIMLAHCAEGGHKNMNYIERVALDWSQKGIDTPEAARAYIKMFNQDFRAIMKAFGMPWRSPGPTEYEYMRSWIKDLQMPLELLVHAADQTLLGTGGKISFQYADSIVQRWHNDGIRTVEAAKLQSSGFKDAKNAASPHSEQGKPKKRRAQAQKPKLAQNRFANFDQRDLDFDEIEDRLLRRTEEGFNNPQESP